MAVDHLGALASLRQRDADDGSASLKPFALSPFVNSLFHPT